MDEYTEGQMDGKLTPISHPAISRCDKNISTSIKGYLFSNIAV